MKYLERINDLKDTQKELLDNFSNIVRYHGVSEETVYYALKILRICLDG